MCIFSIIIHSFFLKLILENFYKNSKEILLYQNDLANIKRLIEARIVTKYLMLINKENIIVQKLFFISSIQ